MAAEMATWGPQRLCTVDECSSPVHALSVPQQPEEAQWCAQLVLPKDIAGGTTVTAVISCGGAVRGGQLEEHCTGGA